MDEFEVEMAKQGLSTPPYTIHFGEISVNIDISCSCARTVFKWLSTLPSVPMLLDHPEAAPILTNDLYYDYLNWALTSLAHLSNEFSKHETEYRRLGIQ